MEPEREDPVLDVPVGDLLPEPAPSGPGDGARAARRPELTDAVLEAVSILQAILLDNKPDSVVWWTLLREQKRHLDDLWNNFAASWTPAPLTAAGRREVYRLLLNPDVSTGDLRNLLDDIERQGDDFGVPRDPL